MNIEINKETHEHKLDGVIRPTVTQVLAGAGIIDTRWYNEYAADRGSKLHRATVLYDELALDETSLDPALKPYLEGYKQFKARADLEILQREKTLYHSIYGFFGTPDIVAWLNNRKAVIDIKSGKPEPWHSLQLWAYAQLLTDNGIAVNDCYGLYLGLGDYRLIQYRNRNDANVFLSALAVRNWKNNGGK